MTRFVSLFISVVVASGGCTNSRSDAPPGPPARKSGTSVEQTGAASVKNIIIFIGDGMGPQAVGLLNAYAKLAEESVYRPDRTTTLERVMDSGTLGMVVHESAGTLVTDSAASATQMASGKRALPETIGIDIDGKPVETILDRAKKLGKSTGLVSDTRLTHATPAAFAAHRTHRSQENDIAADLLQKGVDVMLSGGLRHFLPQNASDRPEVFRHLKQEIGDAISITSRRRDDRNLLDEARAAGYSVVFDRQALAAVSGVRILGLFGDSGLPYRIDLDVSNPKRTVPTLSEMTTKALDVLSRNERGFFLLVESGIIDWAGHDNDAGALLHEMLRFDETLKPLFEFAKKSPETLLLVTADHETGGFSFSYSRRDIPKPTPFPGKTYGHQMHAPNYNFGTPSILDRMYRQKRSYRSIVDALDALETRAGSGDDRAQALMELVNEATEFPITLEDARKVLAEEPNRYRVPGHSELDRETFSKVDDFEAFYVYGDDVRRSNLARVVAGQQNAVWSTGTHTNTPVPIIAWGDQTVAKRFGGLMHTTDWAGEVLRIWE